MSDLLNIVGMAALLTMVIGSLLLAGWSLYKDQHRRAAIYLGFHILWMILLKLEIVTRRLE